MLTTLEAVKGWLSIQNDTDNALLTRLIGAASGYIENYLNRKISSQTYTEKRNGNGKALMLFANYPVTAVSSLKIDGRVISQSMGFDLPGYRFDDELILLIGYEFNRGMMNIELEYTAGFTTTPTEIEQACIELVSLRYKERDRIGHQSKSLAGETVSFFIGDMPASVKTLLNKYRKVVPL